MIKVAALGSGSSGNSLLVQSGSTTLLVDCGFTMKETIARMYQLGVSPTDLDAILISHEHGDHVKGVGPLSRKFGIEVRCTYGTFHRARDNRFPSVRLFHAHEPFTIGSIQVDPFPTPHDAAESCQFVFSVNDVKFANVTDLGVCTPHVQEKLEGVHGLVVECNYDSEMLRNGPYPPSLQARIRSDYGHLGNVQAGELLKKLDHAGLQAILLGHLSEQNNSDAQALQTMQEHVVDRHDRISVLAQHCCSQWFEINARAGAKDAPVATVEAELEADALSA